MNDLPTFTNGGLLVLIAVVLFTLAALIAAAESVSSDTRGES